VNEALILLVGLVALFVAIALALSIVGAITTERAAVNRSLAAVEAISAAPPSMREELDQPFADRGMTPAMDRLTALGRRFTPTDRTDRIKRRLEVAGNPAGWDVDRILAFKALGLFIGGLLGLLIAVLFGLNLLWLILLIVGLALLGWWTPDLALYQVGYNRTERIRRELPDALDLLTISVEAGLGFDAALSQVARNTDGPLAEEFFRVLQEMQIGVGRADAMRALGERTDVPELRAFVTAMVQADSFGIPIANVLRVQSKELRVKRSQMVEEKAQKVPVKILFPLIFCILPVLFIVIIGPAAITIVEAFRGAG
jgi:tight adherence protein C